MTLTRAISIFLSLLPAFAATAQDANGIKYVSPAAYGGCWKRETAELYARMAVTNQASDMCRAQPGKWLLKRNAITSASYGYLQCFPDKCNTKGEVNCYYERGRMPCENLEKNSEAKAKALDKQSEKKGNNGTDLGALMDSDYDKRKAAGTHFDTFNQTLGSEPARTKEEKSPGAIANVATSRQPASSTSETSGKGGDIKIALYLTFAADPAKAKRKNMGYVVGWTSVSQAEIKHFERASTTVLVAGKEVQATRLTTNQYGRLNEDPATNGIVRRFKSAIESNAVSAVAATGKDYDGVCYRRTGVTEGVYCESGLVILSKSFSFEDFVKMHQDHIGSQAAFTVFADIGAF